MTELLLFLVLAMQAALLAAGPQKARRRPAGKTAGRSGPGKPPEPPGYAGNLPAERQEHERDDAAKPGKALPGAE